MGEEGFLANRVLDTTECPKYRIPGCEEGIAVKRLMMGGLSRCLLNKLKMHGSLCVGEFKSFHSVPPVYSSVCGAKAIDVKEGKLTYDGIAQERTEYAICYT
jgi:hypothetical protein